MVANATPVTLHVTWSGASFENGASATGYITFDDSVVPAADPTAGTITLPDASVTALEITITGASSGNGTFGLADFGSLYFWSPVALDLSQELIGQDVGGGCTFGISEGLCGGGVSGDFNLFGQTADASYGIWYFNLATSGGQGDQMLVTSMIASVPERGTLALLGLGLTGLGLSRQRKAR